MGRICAQIVTLRNKTRGFVLSEASAPTERGKGDRESVPTTALGAWDQVAGCRAGTPLGPWFWGPPPGSLSDVPRNRRAHVYDQHGQLLVLLCGKKV